MLPGNVVESSAFGTETGSANIIWHVDDGACPCTMAGFDDPSFYNHVDLISNDLSFQISPCDTVVPEWVRL